MSGMQEQLDLNLVQRQARDRNMSGMQEQLDLNLVQRQARETGICQLQYAGAARYKVSSETSQRDGNMPATVCRSS
jgi:hypothetical protein